MMANCFLNKLILDVVLVPIFYKYIIVLRKIVVICFKQGHVERELDTWIINNWVLGVMYVNTSDHKTMSKARHFDGMRITPPTQNEQLQDFLHLLTPGVCRNTTSWTTFLELGTANCVQSQRAQLSGVIESVNNQMDASHIVRITVSSSYYWARYLTSPRICTYFDVNEQLGVRMQDDARRPYECGEELWPLLGRLHDIDIDTVKRTYVVGARWSFFGTSPPMYLSGPVSLINHACQKHSNVVIKPVDRYPNWIRTRSQSFYDKCVVAVAETRISAGDRVYATYDSDNRALKAARGIECMLCIELK